jgi:uncharacterized protein
MLLLEVARIPPEGLELTEELSPGELHVESGEEFALAPGGSLRCRVERGDDDNVHVRGRLEASLALACGRCLGGFSLPVGQQVDVFYLPERPGEGEEEDVELKDRDMIVAYYAGGRVDLGELVREQLYLALPMKRLCREECRGLCPGCGVNRNAAGCDPRPARRAGRPEELPCRIPSDVTRRRAAIAAAPTTT